MRYRLVLLLLIAASMTAFAQSPPSREIVSSYDLVAPTGVVHVEELMVNGRHQTHVVVTSNEGSGELTFDGRTTRFGDGYAINVTTLANTTNAGIVRFASSDPSGNAATAIIGINHVTGESTAAGVREYAALLHRSHDARVIGHVLPLAVPSATNESTSATAPSIQTVSPPAGASTAPRAVHSAVLRTPLKAQPLSCYSATLAFIGAELAVDIACGTADPACVPALIALGSTFMDMTDQCGGPDLEQTIGWG